MSLANAVSSPASLVTKQTYVPPWSTLSTLIVGPSDTFSVPKNHSTVGAGMPTAAHWKVAVWPISIATSSGGTVIVGRTG